MTQDEIICMAREAGWETIEEQSAGLLFRLERFAALVAAHEREACAKVCEEQDGTWWPCKSTGKECATSVRARGNK